MRKEERTKTEVKESMVKYRVMAKLRGKQRFEQYDGKKHSYSQAVKLADRAKRFNQSRKNKEYSDIKIEKVPGSEARKTASRRVSRNPFSFF